MTGSRDGNIIIGYVWGIPIQINRTYDTINRNRQGAVDPSWWTRGFGGHATPASFSCSSGVR